MAKVHTHRPLLNHITLYLRWCIIIFGCFEFVFWNFRCFMKVNFDFSLFPLSSPVAALKRGWEELMCLLITEAHRDSTCWLCSSSSLHLVQLFLVAAGLRQCPWSPKLHKCAVHTHMPGDFACICALFREHRVLRVHSHDGGSVRLYWMSEPNFIQLLPRYFTQNQKCAARKSRKPCLRSLCFCVKRCACPSCRCQGYFTGS